MVKSFNHIILNNLSLLVPRNQHDLDLKLPLFLLAYRSAVHEITGYTPSEMLLGCKLHFLSDLLLGRPPDTPSSLEEYLRDLQARFEDVHNFPLNRTNMVTERMK